MAAVRHVTLTVRTTREAVNMETNDAGSSLHMTLEQDVRPEEIEMLQHTGSSSQPHIQPEKSKMLEQAEENEDHWKKAMEAPVFSRKKLIHVGLFNIIYILSIVVMLAVYHACLDQGIKTPDEAATRNTTSEIFNFTTAISSVTKPGDIQFLSTGM